MERMTPLSNAAQALSSIALREDAGAILTLLKYPKELFVTLMEGQALNDPFSVIMEEMKIENKFVKNCEQKNKFNLVLKFLVSIVH